jgi:hypothetical protein
LYVDGKALSYVKEYRVIRKHDGVRVLLIRPTRGRSMEVHLDSRLEVKPEVDVALGDYALSVGRPSLSRRKSDGQSLSGDGN